MNDNHNVFELKHVVIDGITIRDYKISPYGRIVNRKGRVLKVREMKNSHGPHLQGYMIVDLFIEGKKVTKLVHRLVAETYIPNLNNLPTVNHKNGNKHMNYWYNLEWSSYYDNNRHALLNELNIHPKGQDCHNATLSNEQVHEICKLIQDGFTYDKIVELLSLEHIENIKSKIKMIKTRNAWAEISTNYIFPEGRNRVPKYPESLIHEICKYLQDFGFTSYQNIITELNIPNTENYKRLIYSIRTHKKYKYISRMYNF